jgi:hypothetical protein
MKPPSKTEYRTFTSIIIAIIHNSSFSGKKKAEYNMKVTPNPNDAWLTVMWYELKSSGSTPHYHRTHTGLTPNALLELDCSSSLLDQRSNLTPALF